MKGGNFLADDRIIRSLVYVDLCPMSVILGHIRIGKDSFNRAFRNASVAIDARVSIDIESVGQFMESFNRADSSAISILTINAWFRHHIGHLERGSFQEWQIVIQ